MSFKRNTAVTGFTVGLISATDGSAITTGTPVGYYTLDGGTQTAIADVTPVHEGNGQWSFGLTAGEMNGDIVGLAFTHTSAIPAYFTIKTDTKIVSELVDLTAIEFNLLLALAEHNNLVLSREQLLERMWGHDYFGEMRVVDVHIGHIRQKLGLPNMITTVRGVGYRFSDEVA